MNSSHSAGPSVTPEQACDPEPQKTLSCLIHWAQLKPSHHKIMSWGRMSCGRELLTTLEEQTHLHCKEVDGRWNWCWSAVQTQAQVTVYVWGVWDLCFGACTTLASSQDTHTASWSSSTSQTLSVGGSGGQSEDNFSQLCVGKGRFNTGEVNGYEICFPMALQRHILLVA